MSDLPDDLFNDMREFSQCEDRFEYLRRWLRRCGIQGKKIEINGKRHLWIAFNAACNYEKPIKVFTSHYDKISGSPGGNDNGAAVFQLLCHAGRLAMEKECGNTQILFTDGEEIENRPVSSQGAYQLAAFLRENSHRNLKFYVFDLCGIGDTIAVGGASSEALAHAHRAGRIAQDFYQNAMGFVEEASYHVSRFQGRPADLVHSLFSDDLGFLLNGFPAAFFSVLPLEEAGLAYANWKAVKSNAAAAEALKKGYLSPEFRRLLHPLTPKSWQTMHTEEDKIERLEKRAFILMENFLNYLSFEA